MLTPTLRNREINWAHLNGRRTDNAQGCDYQHAIHLENHVLVSVVRNVDESESRISSSSNMYEDISVVSHLGILSMPNDKQLRPRGDTISKRPNSQVVSQGNLTWIR
jgi:hypothetical protein